MTEHPPTTDLTATVFGWALRNGGEGAHARPGTWSGQTVPAGRYKALDVEINPHMERVGDLDPATMRITSNDIVAICIANPYGGTMTGFNEDDLIAHFQAQP